VTAPAQRVLIAPDSFKGSATAAEVAAALAAGMRSVRGELAIRELPVADGGEGTVAAAVAAGWHEQVASVSGPLGHEVRAHYATAVVDGVACAVVELAAASGLPLSPADDDAARRASSRGTGELLAHAIDAGARRVVLAVGGSACTDGGAGMLVALGVQLLDHDGARLPDGGDALRRLATVDLAGLADRVGDVEIVLASDVDNPLLGPTGAAAVYGPQKGADDRAVADLEAGLERWVDRLAAAGVVGATGVAERAGAGAAGGVGYAAMVLLGAVRRPGIDVVMELTGLGSAVADADLVVTGEGRIDEQSLRGKAPLGVAELARAAGVPVLLVGGGGGLAPDRLREHGIVGQHLLTDIEPDVARCIAHATSLLQDVGARIARDHA